METKKLIAINKKILAELRNAVGMDDDIFKEERFLELKQRLDEMKDFDARVNHILGNKSRMRLIVGTGKPSNGLFDLRTLNPI